MFSASFGGPLFRTTSSVASPVASARDLITGQIPTIENVSNELSIEGSDLTWQTWRQQTDVNDADNVGLNYGNRAQWDLPSVSNRILIIARVKWDGNAHSSFSRVISQRTSAGGDEEWAIIMDGTGHFIARIGGFSGSDFILVGGITAGDWVHVVLYRDAVEGAISLYGRNGGHIETVTGSPGAISASTANLTIGHRDGENRTWDGWIDYIDIWHGLDDIDALTRAIPRKPWKIYEPLRIPIGSPVAAGGTTPKGPLGHPLHGALGGPIG